MDFIKNIKLNKKKLVFILSVFLLISVGVLGNASIVSASVLGEIVEKSLMLVIGGVLQFIILVVGQIIILVTSTIISVSSYNGFISEPSIVVAWGIVRDFCNMFFILILLVIAFATILRIESYNMKKWLPKLLMMAVFINFSRTIAGLIIDVSQVFMLTFVSAIGPTGGSIIDALGVQKYFTTVLNHSIFSGKDLDFSSVLTGLFLGTAFLIIATIVLIVFLAILIIRMVMLWVYIVLSPLAFLLASFPGGQSYSKQWWDEFIKNAITGPILMFFFWLALIVAGTFNDSIISETSTACFGPSDTVCPSTFLHFVMAIGMLVGGLIVTSKAGGAVGGIAGKGMGAINKGVSMGKAGLGRVTGYDYAKRTGQGYLAMRKTQRDEKIRLSSETLANRVGIAKKATIGGIGRVGTGIKNKTWNNWNGKNKADQLREEIKQDKLRLDEERNKIRNKTIGAKFTDADGYEYTRINEKLWQNGEGTVISDKVLENGLNNRYSKLSRKKNEANELEKRQERWNRSAKLGLASAGLVGGAFTGLPTAVGMLTGAALGGKGLPKLTSAIANAGKDDLSLASNFINKQVNDIREKIKDQDDESIQATMDDSTKDTFTRVAAAMELMSRGKMSTEDVKEKKNWIRDKMGGLDKNGDWNDKRLGHTINALIDQHNPGASNTYEKAYGTIDEIKTKFGYATDEEASNAQVKALREIADGYASGARTMEKTDTQSLLASMRQLVLSLKTGNFVKQFKALSSETKKSEVIQKLIEIDTPESREKLAHITDIKTAYKSDPAGAENFVKGLSAKEMNEIFIEGNDKKIQAVVDVVKSKLSNLSLSVKEEIESNSPLGKALNKKLNNPV